MYKTCTKIVFNFALTDADKIDPIQDFNIC